MEVILQHVKDPPPSLAGNTEISVPDSLQAIVQQCLEKNRDARPRDALELSRRLSETGIEWNAEKAHRWWKMHYPRPDAVAGIR